jgi:cytoskeletal protein RodZ
MSSIKKRKKERKKEKKRKEKKRKEKKRKEKKISWLLPSVANIAGLNFTIRHYTIRTLCVI